MQNRNCTSCRKCQLPVWVFIKLKAYSSTGRGIIEACELERNTQNASALIEIVSWRIVSELSRSHRGGKEGAKRYDGDL